MILMHSHNHRHVVKYIGMFEAIHDLNIFGRQQTVVD
jgi:hypothetical protein